jgi:hypothetical protein
VSERRPPRLLQRLAAAHRRRRKRAEPTGFEFALGDRVGLLNAADWDAVTAGASVFTSRAYLAALDAAAPANVRPQYAIAYRDGAPAVAIAAQFVAAAGEDAIPPGGSCRHTWRRLLSARLLVCGNLLAWGRHGVTFAPGVEPSAAWPAVADALHRMRKAADLEDRTDLVVVKDLGDADARTAGALETYSYRPFETEPDMVLELPESCSTFGDYLGLLRSKYRKAAKGVLADAESAGYRLESVDARGLASPRLHDLYLDARAGAAIRLFELHRDYLPRVASALGPAFRCVGLSKNGAPDGFVTVVRDGATAYGYYVGFDRAANDRAPVYLRLLQAVVEQALDMGCRRISFGRTALEPKSRLGARPVPLRCWVRHRVPLVNLAMRHWLCEVPHAEAPDHSPLKD